MKILFFSNGNTAVFRNGSQVPELQTPWILRYVAWLEEHNIDPLTCEFCMPGGWKVKLFRTSDGQWNWQDAQEAEKKGEKR